MRHYEMKTGVSEQSISLDIFGRLQRRSAYVLLETVVATGMLVVGMAVIGAQVQDSDKAVRKMNLQLRAMMLAEMQLAELDLGLIELDSIDEVQEEDFGPRYPDWAWRLMTEKTALEDMYLLTLEVLHRLSPEGEYQAGNFEFENAEVIYTVRAMRATPRPVDLAVDFGLTETQAEELAGKLSVIGDGLDISAFDPAILARLPFDDLASVLPSLLDAFGVPIDELVGQLPQEIRDALDESGLLEGLGGQGGAGEVDGAEDRGQPGGRSGGR